MTPSPIVAPPYPQGIMIWSVWIFLTEDTCTQVAAFLPNRFLRRRLLNDFFRDFKLWKFGLTPPPQFGPTLPLGIRIWRKIYTTRGYYYISLSFSGQRFFEKIFEININKFSEIFSYLPLKLVWTKLESLLPNNALTYLWLRFGPVVLEKSKM